MSIETWINGKSREELDAIEHEGRTLFRDALRRRKKDGTIEEVPVLVRVPRKPERALARRDAVAWAKELQIDRKEDAGIFDDMDTICIVARSLREPTRPDEQFLRHEQLAAAYDTRTIWDIWDRINFYEGLSDPRVVEWDEQTFWTAIAAIARVRNLSPLTGIGGRELDSFVMRMASELSSYRTARSYAPSTETSTLAS